MKSFSFSYDCEPLAKERPRVALRGKFPHVYTPSKTMRYEAQVRDAFLAAAKKAGLDVKELGKDNKKRILYSPMFPKDKAIKISITATFAVPKSFSKKKKAETLRRPQLCMERKDVDNIAKAILDALNGCAFGDDRQIVELVAAKKYGEASSVTVTLSEAE